MKNFLKNKQFFYILLLIFIAGFLVLPNIALADEFDDITLRETAKYLELPNDKVQGLIQSLINIFYSEWVNLTGSGYFTAEEMAVPSIMKKAVQLQVLNHLLIDAPIETTWLIIQNAIKIVRIFLTQDISGVLDKLEKESVKKAVGYGINALLEDDIKMSPGAIEFEYKLKEGGTGKALIQYIMIYKPFDIKKGEMIVRFYSVESLKPPENKSSIGSRLGGYTELEHDLPPFIVEIRGEVEDYKWVGNPSIDIDFPPEVPDLGIKPLSLWEKYVLKPIETTIKDVEIIITKITGKPLGLLDIWEEIKKFISKIKSFTPAGLVETQPTNLDITKQENLENIYQAEKLSLEEPLEIESQLVNIENKIEIIEEEKLTLEEIQEMLDDITEQIDVLSQEITGLVAEKETELVIEEETTEE